MPTSLECFVQAQLWSVSFYSSHASERLGPWHTSTRGDGCPDAEESSVSHTGLCHNEDKQGHNDIYCLKVNLVHVKGAGNTI